MYYTYYTCTTSTFIHTFRSKLRLNDVRVIRAKVIPTMRSKIK